MPRVLVHRRSRECAFAFAFAFVVALVFACLTRVAHAQRLGGTEPDETAHVAPHLAPDPIQLEERRVPNYDGRDDAPEGSRLALWIPRVLLSPLYFATEYVLRRPLRYLFSLGGNSTFDPLSFFVFGERDQLAIVPTFLVDFGNQPSAGLYARWDEAGHALHKMRFHFATWGPDWLKGRVTSRWESDRFLAEIRVSAQRRRDGLFAGVGSASRPGELRARYQFREYAGRLTLEARPWRLSEVRADFGVREMKFTSDGFNAPSIDERVAQGQFDRLPDGYEGYAIYEQRLRIDLNSRRSQGNTSGIQVRLEGRHAFDLRNPLERRWFAYGASVVGHLDVGARRTLSLSASMQATEVIAGRIPFTELPDLGGSGPLPGFRFGAAVGESTASLVARYSWPIWVWLNATLHAGIGNAFDGRFEGFSLANQRFGFGVGLSAVNNIDHIVNFILAWGTDTFERGADVVSFRVVLGATWRL